MSTPSLADLRTAWSARIGVIDDLADRDAIDLLADGKPATPAALAEATGVSVDEAAARIENARRVGVEVEDGAIVGCALTLRFTQHRFRVRGNDPAHVVRVRRAVLTDHAGRTRRRGVDLPGDRF